MLLSASAESIAVELEGAAFQFWIKVFAVVCHTQQPGLMVNAGDGPFYVVSCIRGGERQRNFFVDVIQHAEAQHKAANAALNRVT